MLDLNYGTVPFAASDCCLSFTARETEARYVSLASCCHFQLQLFLGGRTRRDLAGKADQHSCIWPRLLKSLLTPVSILKLGQIALPSPLYKTLALRERRKI